jgi:hypothetical protein
LNPEGNFIVCLYDEMHVALLFAHWLEVVPRDVRWSSYDSIILRVLLKIFGSGSNYNNFIPCWTLSRLNSFPIYNEILVSRSNHSHSLGPDVVDLTIFSKRFYHLTSSVVLVPRCTVIVVSNRLNKSVYIFFYYSLWVNH